MIDRRARLAQADPAIYALIQREVERQEHGLELIASENFATMAVMEAMGTALTNKYAEGLPKKRYYGGCEVVDEVEQLAIDRAKALFKAEHVNVQPHSGAQANMAAYLAVAKLGDTLLGLALPHGGHLTHGSPVNFSGMLFRPTAYGVREDTGRIDYDQVREIARRERPRILVGGGSAYARALAAAVVERGCAIVPGGADTHLMLVALRPKGLTGKEAQALLDRAGITVNKNTIPGDPRSPFVPSGIRIGTPAVTTRGFTEPEMERVADMIDTVLTKQDDASLARVKVEVRELTAQFPLYAAPADRKSTRLNSSHSQISYAVFCLQKKI